MRTPQAYWNWSWDELASNDLSAMLQYAYDQSGQQKVHYVGHSLVSHKTKYLL